ncbi:PREDICTED: receptor-like protein 12 [Camelina sativa]|uniref:Receptor-like protein 12 n=1 Tax=Camelina sativa TaxID=90675 RepID=A0ABM0VWQ8_CAMSA|nr:PREDICTED: receptor-like protein 12 [Camelina sativa]
MVTTIVLVRDEDDALRDQEGHLRNEQGRKLDVEGNVIAEPVVNQQAVADEEKQQQGNNFTRTYGNSSYQSPHPQTPSESRMEAMLEQLLQGQENMTVTFNGKIDNVYTELTGRIDALNVHVKQLESQVAQTAGSKQQQGNNFTRTYGNSSYQSPHPQTPSESRMEAMLEQLLQGQENMTVTFNGKIDNVYTELTGRIDALNVHVKQLESQVAQTAGSVKRDALLEFKSEFSIQKPVGYLVVSYGSSYPKTESWVNRSDCCSWDGITCAAKSGKVIGLDLSSSNLHGPLKSKSSLFRMRHLRDLNLAYNNFTGSPIPAEFDKLMELKRLNLSWSSLSGKIPINLLQLTKLVSLDLSSSLDYDGSSFLSIDGSFLHLLAQNLRNLRKLDMSNVNISIPHEFSNMRSLRSLHLTNCNLSGEFPSSVLLIPSLQSIRLSLNPNLRGNLPMFRENNSLVEMSTKGTAFSGLIPDSISRLKHLTSLTLSVSKFSGKIPISLGNLSHLSILDLGGNNFVGEIPSSIGNLKQLTVFDVSSNKLNGNLPISILNFTQLRRLWLSPNQFTGFLPPNISQFSKLESFLGGDDSFTGAILSSLLKIPSLTRIYLSYNKFSDLTGIGNISLLPNLLRLGISSIESKNYKVIGPGVDLNVFSPLKKLHSLSLSRIPLSTTNITSDSDFLPNLAYLDLRGCNIIEFPEFIRNGRKLQTLDLSNNKIKGQVPDWLWRLPKLFQLNLSNNSLSGFNGSSQVSLESQISTVYLSSNAFQGPLFIPSSQRLYYFSGSKNNFTGEIPRSVCGLSTLAVLDLSNNNLNGSIPRCLETMVINHLSDLDLRNNSLSGILPEIFQNAKSLITLDVSQNRLEGKMPASLGGCSALQVLNVGSNTFNDIFPFHLKSLQKLQVFILRSNKFNGTLHNSDGVWFGFPQLKIIDVSYNDFFGTLPSDYFLNWTAMSSKRDDNIELEYINSGNSYYSLVLMSKGVAMEMECILTIYTSIDFSGNQLHGPIPDSVGLLTELLILNLSSNAFTGHIPSTLVNLTNLESLDLSQNKISGEIPPELGALSSLEVINVSHNQLVGSIPQGTQFQRQNCSSYEGNPGLNGPSLKDVCRDIKALAPPQSELMESKEEEEEESFSWNAAGLGFAPGVVFGLAMGYIAVSYKHEWFMKRFGRNKRQSIRTR